MKLNLNDSNCKLLNASQTLSETFHHHHYFFNPHNSCQNYVNILFLIYFYNFIFLTNLHPQ